MQTKGKHSPPVQRNRRVFCCMMLAFMARALAWCIPHWSTNYAPSGLINVVGIAGYCAFRHHFHHGVKLWGEDEYFFYYFGVEKLASIVFCFAFGFPGTCIQWINVLLPHYALRVLLSQLQPPLMELMRLLVGDLLSEFCGCILNCWVWYLVGEGVGWFARCANHALLLAFCEATDDITADDTSSHTSAKAKEATLLGFTSVWQRLQVLLGLVDNAKSRPPNSSSGETTEANEAENNHLKELNHLDQQFMRHPPPHCIFCNTLRNPDGEYVELLVMMPTSKYKGKKEHEREFSGYAVLADGDNKVRYLPFETTLAKDKSLKQNLQRLTNNGTINWVKAHAPNSRNKFYHANVNLADPAEQKRIKVLDSIPPELQCHQSLPLAAK